MVNKELLINGIQELGLNYVEVAQVTFARTGAY